jgi:hypothetical protein
METNIITTKQIPQQLKIRGIGVTANLIKENGTVAMFLREDGYFETGKIKRATKDHTWPSGASIHKGDFQYWSDEDFGLIAKTTKYRDVAEQHYVYFQNNAILP